VVTAFTSAAKPGGSIKPGAILKGEVGILVGIYAGLCLLSPEALTLRWADVNLKRGHSTGRSARRS